MIEAAMDEWAIGLHGLTGEQIKRGIDVSRVKSDWPPSIAKFVEFANGDAPRGAAYRIFKALPRPKASPEIARAGLAQMRAVLGVVRRG